MSILIQNAVYCIDTELYHKSSSGKITFYSCGLNNLYIDGGLECIVRSEMPPTVIDYSLYSDSPYEEIKEKLLWGTYGKDGTKPFRWVPLIQCTDEHLYAILETQKHLPSKTVDLIKDILNDRQKS